MHWRRKWQPIPVLLPGESLGRGSLVGCRLWGHTESDRLKRLSSSSRRYTDAHTPRLPIVIVPSLWPWWTPEVRPQCSRGLKAFSSVQSLSHVRLFASPWTAARQASLSITNSRSLLKLMSTESVMPSNHLILCHPLLLLPQSFPASGSFPMSQLFASGGQSIGVSALASVLPMNIQDWSPLGWTGWISLQSKGLSRVFSSTTVQKHQFFGTQLSLWANSHIHT